MNFLNILRRSSTDPTPITTEAAYQASLNKEYEDNDFLVVAETERERSTILPSHMQPSNPQRNNLPPYPGAPPPSYGGLTHLPRTTASTYTVTPSVELCHGRNMIADVPFMLDKHLQLLYERAQQAGAFSVPEMRQPNLNEYWYDFEVERDVIKWSGDSQSSS